MFNARFDCVLVASLAIASAIGCGRNDLRVVPVKGRVTFNGNPVDKAEVCFIRDADTAPKGGPAPPAIARTGIDGTFSLVTGEQPGAVPGSYRVTVQKTNFDELPIPNPLPKPYRKKDVGAYMMAHNLVPSQLLPERYADMRGSPLTAEVSADASKNNFDFALEGEPPRRPPAQPGKTGQ